MPTNRLPGSAMRLDPNRLSRRWNASEALLFHAPQGKNPGKRALSAATGILRRGVGP